MKRYSRVFTYLKDYKASVLWYFVTVVLSITFSILSLGMLFPFLQLLFNKEGSVGNMAKQSGNPVIAWVNGHLNHLISSGDQFYALGIVCVLIILTIFF